MLIISTEMNGQTQSDLLVLLHDVARLIRLEADKRARLHDLTRAQWVLLLKLARHPGLSQKDLAEILEVEPMSVARLIDRLTTRGLVERRADPRDRRIWRLHLCPKAEPLLRLIEAQRAELAAQVLGHLPPSVINTMTEGLYLMKLALLNQAFPAQAGCAQANDSPDSFETHDPHPAKAEQELV